MASGLFSSIQSLSTKLLHAIRGTTSPLHQQDPASPVSDRNESVREDLEKLSRMLVRIEAVQQDAEEREIHDRSVRMWLAELRGVAYQAEDVLDEFYYEVLRSIVDSGDAAIEAYHREKGTRRKFAEKHTSSPLASYSFIITKATIPDGMTEKIKGITERFEEISNARRDLNLREEDGTRLVISPEIRLPTSSHVDERAIFGREEEKEKIISVMNPSSGPDFMVLPIVGMGGAGKTTLAQLVYNDSRICRMFNKRCWISVSEDFDLVRLSKAIIDSVSDNPCESSELSKLQDVLKEKLRGVGLFLVLDDVWNERKKLWEAFEVGFFGAKFVRILTTTRNTSVAKIMQTVTPLKLKSLPNEKCWSLFKHFAFGNTEASENIHRIGHGIIKKCKGSPLAIKALGGILRYEMDEEKWSEILESDISKIDETGEVMSALRLSYQKLPQHLKPCFLYLSMFPKGTSFEKDMVVRLWMAQGYIIGNTTDSKTLEDIGREYFDELQGRSLVNHGTLPKYFLHDLIHDLARSISQETYASVLKNDQHCKVHHLYLTEQDKLLGSFLAPSNYWSIRTVVKECPTQNFDFAIFSKFACARALQLRYSLLPNTLGILKHLRYLSVKHNRMETLPETLCLLYNLQTLDLNTSSLRELPENIKHLIKLQYFQLSSSKIQQLPESIFLLRNLHTLSLKYCTKLKELPRGIEQLTRLRILDLLESPIKVPSGIGKLTALKSLSGHFCVMDHDMIGGLGELTDMNKLSGFLCISGLRNIRDAEYSRNANLESKPNFHKLNLNFQDDLILNCKYQGHLHLGVHSSKNVRNENDENIQDVVLQSLRPHGNLTELAILNYGGRIFPSWLLNPLLLKLTTLTLNFCTEPNFLPPFGQLPYLKFLEISGSDGVRNVENESNTYSLLAEYGSSKQPKEPSYPSLEVLSLRNALNLVEWQAHDGDFPSLKQITIENCPKLSKIAIIPQEVREVTFKHCPKLKHLTCPSVIKNLTIHECGFCDIVFGSISESLMITKCIELISIDWINGGLNSVRVVTFEYCPNLELLTIPIGTMTLMINNCGIREVMFQSVSGYLTISNCIELISINWMDGGLNSVEAVTFEHCPKLELVTIPVSLNSIREVRFELCPKLEVVTIPVGTLTLTINECGFREIIFQSVSDYLTISNCIELISIKWIDEGLNYVRAVTFEHCPKLKLVTIPVETWTLMINKCGLREIMFRSVSGYLTISNCTDLISINWMEGGLNSVKEVSFTYCPKLKLPTIPTGIKKLKIAYCGIQEITFPLQSNIRMVDVFHCPMLTSIHWAKRARMLLVDCPKLQKGMKNLRISSCPVLQFPLKDLLQSMSQRAEIYDCPRMNLGKRYVYQRDTTIEELNLFGNNEICQFSSPIPLLENPFTLFFTKEDFQEAESLTCEPWDGVSCHHIMLNLASLVRLEILGCTKVISVTGLNNLSNLKLLSISYCPELCNWNDKTLPLSLEFLELNSCDKLSSLPLLSVQNHSSTLKDLVVKKCPRLAVLEGFHGLKELNTVELLHCRNISISPDTEILQFKPLITTIGGCPQMKDWCRRNTITYYELIDNPHDDKAKLESAKQERAKWESGEQSRAESTSIVLPEVVN